MSEQHDFQIFLLDGLASELAAKSFNAERITAEFERGPCGCGVVGCPIANIAASQFVRGVTYGALWSKAVPAAAAPPIVIQLQAPAGGLDVNLRTEPRDIEIVRDEEGRVSGARSST